MSDERPPCTCLRLLGRPGRACDSCPPPAEATTHDTGPTVREAAADDQRWWDSEKTVARWRAVLYPPQPAPDGDGPTVREAAADDRAYWEQRDAGEGA